MASWYFVKEGERTGPVDRSELDARIAAGAVDGDTLVWRVGFSAWTRAALVEELAVPPPLPSSRTQPPALPVRPEESADGDVNDASNASDDVQTAWGEPSRTTRRPEPTRGYDTGRAPHKVEFAPVFAGFWIRLAAKLIDGVLLSGIALLVERAVVAMVFNGVAPAPFDWEGFLRLIVWTAPVNTLIAIVYTVYFMAKHEATPGKRILGLRVVRADGGRMGTGHVIGRYFAETLSTVIFFTGYVMAAFDDEKRTLHDYLCDTRVVIGERESARTEQRTTGFQRPPHRDGNV